MMQSCYLYFPSPSPELQRGRWTDFSQEASTPGIYSKMPLLKGIVYHLKWLSSSRKSTTSSRKVKSVEEVKYGEFVRPFPNNNRKGARYHVGPPGYYTRVDNRPPFGEKKLSLGELMNKHIVESTRKRAKMEEWMKKLLESTKLNTRNQNDSLKNLETQFEQLAKEATAANEVPDLSVGQCNVIFANCEAPTYEASSKGTTRLQGVSFIYDDNV
nr:hypothetical protein [Tanacetum cinerariifolium]GEZ05636.1 hypothetical protein [Tanacetum cinerariifolium]